MIGHSTQHRLFDFVNVCVDFLFPMAPSVLEDANDDANDDDKYDYDAAVDRSRDSNTCGVDSS
jgi:hypothetical protein